MCLFKELVVQVNKKRRKVPANRFDHGGTIEQIRDDKSSHYNFLVIHITAEKAGDISIKRN